MPSSTPMLVSTHAPNLFSCFMKYFCLKNAKYDELFKMLTGSILWPTFATIIKASDYFKNKLQNSTRNLK